MSHVGNVSELLPGAAAGRLPLFFKHGNAALRGVRERAALTVVGERLEQTVQAALHAVGGAVCGRQLQLLQGFAQVVCREEETGVQLAGR